MTSKMHTSVRAMYFRRMNDMHINFEQLRDRERGSLGSFYNGRYWTSAYLAVRKISKLTAVRNRLPK